MPKLKTKSSAKKRFVLTGSGKIKRKHAFKSHILTKKATDRKRNLTRTGAVDTADVPAIQSQMGWKTKANKKRVAIAAEAKMSSAAKKRAILKAYAAQNN